MPDPANILSADTSTKNTGLSIAHTLSGQDNKMADNNLAVRDAVPFLVTDEPKEKEGMQEPLSEEGKEARSGLLLLASSIESNKDKILAAGSPTSKTPGISPEQIDEFLDGLRAAALSNDEETIKALQQVIESSNPGVPPVKQLTAQLQQTPSPDQHSNGEVIQRLTIEELAAMLLFYSPAIIVAIILLVLSSRYLQQQRAAAAAIPRGRRLPPPGGPVVAAPKGHASAAPKGPAPTAPKGPASAAPKAVLPPAHLAPVTYRVGDTVELENASTAQAALDVENAANLAAYQTAKALTAQYKQQRDLYNYDRDPNFAPAGAHPAQLSLGAPVNQGAYGNAEGYFPAGHNYTEFYINPGVGAPGNYRMITPNAPIGNHTRWVGSNITHPPAPPNWIRVWNNALLCWQNWDHTTLAAANLAGHVAIAPVDPRTPAQVTLAENGYLRKTLAPVHGGFELGIIGALQKP